MLAFKGVHAHYGPIHALRGIDLRVREGEIVTLIGANGAGKSTLMTSIFGAPRISSGQLLLRGRDIGGVPSHQVSRLGIALSPEGRRIFQRLSVLENLQLGATCSDPGHWGADLERVFHHFPVLKDRQDQRAGTLSGGEQQMLAIGRALVSRPRLLLLDEPSLGLAPIYIRKIFQIIHDINRSDGVSVLLVEQNAHHALRLAHQAYVLQHGEIVLSGSGHALLNSAEVRAAYLAGENAEAAEATTATTAAASSH
ncbi:MAG: ABC transporter ATP-binding protein [Proteobacteria bacterium]|nr:ABC transporter ATP-binding protein [Pseudomonadota bacterium]